MRTFYMHKRRDSNVFLDMYLFESLLNKMFDNQMFFLTTKTQLTNTILTGCIVLYRTIALVHRTDLARRSVLRSRAIFSGTAQGNRLVL